MITLSSPVPLESPAFFFFKAFTHCQQHAKCDLCRLRNKVAPRFPRLKVAKSSQY